MKKQDFETVNKLFAEFDTLFAKDEISKRDVVELLNKFLPNFEHIEKGKGLDQSM